MSIITFNGTSGFSFEWDFTAVGLVTSASSTEIILALDGGGTLTLGGTFPTLDPITSRPTSGTIDTIDIASGGETIAIMTSLSAFDFFTWVDANDGTAFNTALLAGNDTITGTPWNDNLIGLSGNDTVYTGGGQDAVHTGAGDDIIALTGPILSGSNFNGGDDDDTIRASIAAAAAPVQPTDLYSTVGLFSAIVSGVETIEFDSQSGEHLRVGMGVWQIGQITGLTGGDGSDQLLVLVTSQVTTSYVLPTLTLTDWNADDSIMLFGTSPVGTTADFTLDSSAYGGQAILIGGAGNDTLTSGAGNDLVVTGGGLDNVHTGAGDDIIVFDGISFGATFNGGDDEDTLRVTSGSMFAIGGPLGNATLLGSSVVTDIETLELASQAGEQLNVLTNAFQLGGFTTLRGGAGTDFLIVSVPAGGGTVTLPGLNLVDWTDGEDILLLSAVGNLDPSIGYTLGTDDHTGTYYIGGGAGNDTLNGADGIDVLTGNGGNDTMRAGEGNDTLNGSAGEDTLDGEEGDDMLTGGADADVFQVSQGQDVITDFVPGVDKLDVSEAGFTSFAQLQAYLAEDLDGNAVWSFLFNGVVNTTTLQGIALADLAETDFIFASPTDPRIIDGTDNADTLLGSGVGDTINGLGGADLIYTGGGLDNVHAGAGDDIIVLTGPVGGGSTFNGGDDEDTIRASIAAAAAPVQPTDLYSTVGLFSAIVSGVETIEFDSQSGEHLRVGMGVWQIGQITGLTGGDGSDQLQVILPSAVTTSFTLSALTLTDWNADDNVMLVGVSQGATPSNFTLDSSAYGGQAVLIGGAGNDTLTSGAGDDYAITGGGLDSVHTGAGDDIIILNGPVSGGSTFNGGDDEDTIRVSMAAAAAPVQPTDLYSTVGLFSAIVSGVETIEFDSQSGEHLRVGMGVWQIGQVTGLTGGDGSDQLLVIVPSTLTTSFTLAPLTLTDWNADDSIMLLGSSPVGTTADFTLDSSAYGGQALLIGGAGNDTLTSGAGNDLVVTGGGLDVVDAGAGDDIINLNGTVSGGSVFDGGDDDDTAIFSDASTDHAISAVAGQPGAIQVDGFQIIDIEHLQFTDGTFHWDTTSGLVADGYLSGTTVWHDDGNGILDPYEPFAITDANGNFELSSYIDGPLLAMGGINIDTGLPNDLLLSAPAGSTVVNPLTTLVQTIIETSGADGATAEDQVKAALGLDPSLDLTTLDLIAAAASGDADALEAQKAAASVAKILDTVVDNGGNPDDALAVLASQIVAADDNETTLDLGDGSEGGLLDKVFTDAGVPEGDIDDLIAETQETIENIEQAETLDDISDVQAGDLVDVTGGNGKDVLDGFDSNDRLSGKNGSDILHGGGGSDLVLGGNGKDELHGGDGADVLAGGNGPDTMWGDAGNDIFAFAAGESAGGDVVKDFDVGDKLFLAAGLGVASKTISGGSTVLSLSDGGTITLEGYAYQGDYNDLLLAGPLPLWAQSWTVA